MSLPGITHLQWLILGLLVSSEQSGQQLRELLAKRGVQKDGPAFYQLMGRLESAGLVKGRYVQEVVAGQIFKQRFYRLTPKARKAWQDTRKFYAN